VIKPGSVGGRALRGQLEELYRTRYERFLRVALAIVGDDADARDAVQEMWAKLGGIALVIVIVGWTLARVRFLAARLRAWWQSARSGTSTEQPILWTLGLARPEAVSMQLDERARADMSRSDR